MSKVAIVGVEGSGKTVLMAAFSELFGTVSQDTVYLLPENQSAFTFMTHIPHLLRKERSWPAATTVDSLRNMKWSLRVGQDVVSELQMLDYPGELYRLAFGERTESELAAHRAEVHEFLEHVVGAELLVVLLNLNDVMEIGGNHRNAETVWITRGIFDYAKQLPSVKDVLLVFTQADRYAAVLDAEGGPAGVLKRYLPMLSVLHPGLQAIAVAAVDATASDGSPQTGYASKGLHDLMGRILLTPEQRASFDQALSRCEDCAAQLAALASKSALLEHISAYEQALASCPASAGRPALVRSLCPEPFARHTRLLADHRGLAEAVARIEARTDPSQPHALASRLAEEDTWRPVTDAYGSLPATAPLVASLRRAYGERAQTIANHVAEVLACCHDCSIDMEKMESCHELKVRLDRYRASLDVSLLVDNSELVTRVDRGALNTHRDRVARYTRLRADIDSLEGVAPPDGSTESTSADTQWHFAGDPASRLSHLPEHQALAKQETWRPMLDAYASLPGAAGLIEHRRRQHATWAADTEAKARENSVAKLRRRRCVTAALIAVAMAASVGFPLLHRAQKTRVALTQLSAAFARADWPAAVAAADRVLALSPHHNEATSKKREALDSITASRLAEEARIAEKARRAEADRRAEEARVTEQARSIVAEEARRAEQARVAELARSIVAEETRLEARRAEQARVAELARSIVAEEARLAQQARVAEEARLAEEARRVEEARATEALRPKALFLPLLRGMSVRAVIVIGGKPFESEAVVTMTAGLRYKVEFIFWDDGRSYRSVPIEITPDWDGLRKLPVELTARSAY